LAKSQPKDTKH